MSSYKTHTTPGDFYGTCQTTGKRGYETRKQARRARQAGGHRHGNPYMCEHCGWFHLGRYHAAQTRDQYRKQKNGYVKVREAAKQLNVSEETMLIALDHLEVQPDDGYIPEHAVTQLQKLTYRKD